MQVLLFVYLCFYVILQFLFLLVFFCNLFNRSVIPFIWIFYLFLIFTSIANFVVSVFLVASVPEQGYTFESFYRTLPHALSMCSIYVYGRIGISKNGGFIIGKNGLIFEYGILDCIKKIIACFKV